MFDTQTGKVVLTARCFVPSKKDPQNLKTRDELLADNASQLKALIGKKIDMCLAIMDNTKATIKVAGAPAKPDKSSNRVADFLRPGLLSRAGIRS